MPSETDGKEASLAPPFLTTEEIDRFLSGSLAYARAKDYCGWNKHDALNSPLLEALSLGLPFPRLCLIQGVMRFPINLRGLLRVKPARNNKGIALFARALLDRGRALNHEEDLAEAAALLDWLLDHPAPYPQGMGWGYPYPWQDGGFFAPRHSPNRVVTTFVAQALMEGYEVLGNGRYLEAIDEVCEFLVNAPTRIVETPDQLCLSYVPDPRVSWVVMDVSILAAAVLARRAALTGRNDHLAEARRLTAYVVNKQTEYHAWYYSHPPGDARITHDNYHTGFILDALHDYMKCTGDHEWKEAYINGLAFYRDRLFDPDGAPRWMHDKPFPRDIHGSAQGILSFVRAAEDPVWGDPAYADEARKIASWACRNLWLPGQKRFAWQQTPHCTKTHDLLRWCQGWMVRSLASLLRYESEQARLEKPPQ